MTKRGRIAIRELTKKQEHRACLIEACNKDVNSALVVTVFVACVVNIHGVVLCMGFVLFATQSHNRTGGYDEHCIKQMWNIAHSINEANEICPHSVFMFFVWILEQTAKISLYSIN